MYDKLVILSIFPFFPKKRRYEEKEKEITLKQFFRNYGEIEYFDKTELRAF